MSEAHEVAAHIGPYRVIAKLQQEAFGSSYLIRVHHARGDAGLALLKQLTAPALGSDEFVAGLLRDVELAAELSHPNVASVYGANLQDDGICIASEYIDGLP